MHCRAQRNILATGPETFVLACDAQSLHVALLPRDELLLEQPLSRSQEQTQAHHCRGRMPASQPPALALAVLRVEQLALSEHSQDHDDDYPQEQWQNLSWLEGMQLRGERFAQALLTRLLVLTALTMMSFFF